MGYEKQNRPLLGAEFNDPEPAAGQIYVLGNSTATTIASANTPVKADVGAFVFTTTQSGGVAWDADNTRFEIGVGRRRLYSIVLRCRLTGTTGDIAASYVAINGTVPIASVAFAEIHSAQGTDTQTTTTLAYLEAGDYVEVWVANELATNDVTVDTCALEIHPV